MIGFKRYAIMDKTTGLLLSEKTGYRRMWIDPVMSARAVQLYYSRPFAEAQIPRISPAGPFRFESSGGMHINPEMVVVEIKCSYSAL